MEVVKVASPAPQMDKPRDASFSRAVRVQAMTGDGGGAGEDEGLAHVLASGQVGAQGLDQAAQELAGHYNLKMEVAWDERTGRQVLKVLSPEGDRLLRQFPAEAVLRMAERLRSGTDDGLLTSLV